MITHRTIIINDSQPAAPAFVYGEIYASQNHSFYVNSSNALWGWGYNISGQLGDNTVVSKMTPTGPAGTSKTWRKVGAGFLFSMGITTDGKAYGFGDNSAGMLGTNNTTAYSTPVAIYGQSAYTFCHIAVAQYHTIALDNNGKAWAWGQNGMGQLGTNNTTSYSVPVAVQGATKTFCFVSAGLAQNNSFAIDKNGKIWGWGNGDGGSRGSNSVGSVVTPVAIAGATKTWAKVAGASLEAIGLTTAGAAWCWGSNDNGGLGVNSVTAYSTPVAVCGGHVFNEISKGVEFTAAIDTSGQLWTWGLNTYGQLGDNSVASKRTPIAVYGTHTFCKVSCGGTFMIAEDKDGVLWGWGNSFFGRTGLGNTTNKSTPVAIGNI